MPGSITSSTITSNGSFEARASPTGPSPAVSTSYPSPAKRSDTVSATEGSSSTNKMRELIHPLRSATLECSR